MKQPLPVVLTGAMVLAFFGLVASAATPPTKAAPASQPKPQAFVVEGKILETYSRWFELSVTKIIRGAGLKVGDKVKITERSTTKFLQKGKAVGRSALKAGELLRVEGQTSKPAVYEATTVTILK